jgi:hypothetical protein
MVKAAIERSHQGVGTTRRHYSRHDNRVLFLLAFNKCLYCTVEKARKLELHRDLKQQDVKAL